MNRHVQFAVQQQTFDLLDEYAKAHPLQGSFFVDVPLCSDGDDLEFPIGV